MLNRYTLLLGVAGAVLSVSSSMAGSRPLGEGDGVVFTRKFSDNCDKNTFIYSSALNHATCKSCKDGSGTYAKDGTMRVRCIFQYR